MSEQGMWNMTGWHRVGCNDSNDLRNTPGFKPVSSLTDPDDLYGSGGVVFTEWALAGGTPTLRDYRWPNSDRECEHWEADILVPLVQSDGGAA